MTYLRLGLLIWFLDQVIIGWVFYGDGVGVGGDCGVEPWYGQLGRTSRGGRCNFQGKATSEDSSEEPIGGGD